MNIPTYEPNQVSPQVKPTPTYERNKTWDTLANVGGQLEQTALQGVNHLNEIKFQANKSLTQGKVATYNKEVVDLMNGPFKASGDPSKPDDYKIESGFLNSELEQSVPIVQQGLEKLKQLRNKYLDGFTDPQQKQMFLAATANDEASYDLDLNRHHYKESKQLEDINSKALEDSYAIKAGTHYRDMGPGGLFEKDIASMEDVAHSRLDGKIPPVKDGKPNPAYVDAVRQITAPAYMNAIEKLSLESPLEAEAQLNRLDAQEKISLNVSEHLWKELHPKLEAYKDQAIVDQLKQYFPKNVDEPWDRDMLDKKVDEITQDPITRKRVKADLKQKESDWQDSITKKYAALKGTINMKYGRPYWEKGQQCPIEPVKSSEEFGKLTKGEQDSVLDKIDAENWKIREHREKMASEERTRQSTERTARKTAEAEKHKETVKEQDKEAAYWLTHSEELEKLNDDQVQSLNVSHADLKTIASEKKKLTTPKALHHAKVEDTAIKNILTTAGIKETDQLPLIQSAKSFIAAEQERKGAFLTSDETEAAMLKGLQYVYKDETVTHTIGKDTKSRVQKRRMEVKEKDVVYPDDVVKKVDTYIKGLPADKRKLAEKNKQKYLEEALKDKALGGS